MEPRGRRSRGLPASRCLVATARRPTSSTRGLPRGSRGRRAERPAEVRVWEGSCVAAACGPPEPDAVSSVYILFRPRLRAWQVLQLFEMSPRRTFSESAAAVFMSGSRGGVAEDTVTTVDIPRPTAVGICSLCIPLWGRPGSLCPTHGTRPPGGGPFGMGASGSLWVGSLRGVRARRGAPAAATSGPTPTLWCVGTFCRKRRLCSR